MRNFTFPETDVVKCVFSLRQGSAAASGAYHAVASGAYDEYDRQREIAALKEYFYRLPKSLAGKIKPGQFVVVHCKTGYQICEVVKINATVGAATYKDLAPVVCTVELDSYIQEIENQKALELMRAKIEEEKKRLEKTSLYDLLAEKNPEFKQMLEAFRSAGGEL